METGDFYYRDKIGRKQFAFLMKICYNVKIILKQKMFLHCFENLNAENPFFEGRLVNMSPRGGETPRGSSGETPSDDVGETDYIASGGLTGTDLETISGLRSGAHPGKVQKATSPEADTAAQAEANKDAEKKSSEADAEAERDKVEALKQAKVEAAKKARGAAKKSATRIAKRGEKEVMQRVVGDVFKNDQELDQFKEKVRESIETLDPNALYEFVENHQAYGGNFIEWNGDFCKLLGVDEQDPKEQRKYAAGLQLFLINQFTEATPAFAFELKKGGRTNNFTKIDGMIGCYTVSVLRAYLVKLHPNKQKGWEMKRASLTDGFKKKYPSRKPEFTAAMNHLGEYFDEKPVEDEDDEGTKPSQAPAVSKSKVEGYPKLNPSPKVMAKAQKKPQTKHLVEAFVGKRYRGAKAKLDSQAILQIGIIDTSLKNYDISDLGAFENIRSGSKFALAFEEFMKVANPLAKLKARTVRDIKAEKSLEIKYHKARLNLLKATSIYHAEEMRIIRVLQDEFIPQVTGASLVIDLPLKYRSNFKFIMGSDFQYRGFHSGLVSNFLSEFSKNRIPKQFNRKFLGNPELITRFIKMSLNNREIRTFTSYKDLKNNFQSGSLEMLNEIFPTGTPSGDILLIMNRLIVMANCYRLREDAGLKEEVYLFRLKEEQRKIDPKPKSSRNTGMIASAAN